MNIRFQIPIEFANTIAKVQEINSTLSAAIYNANKTLKYVNSFPPDSELKEYLLSKLIQELNSLKSVEFEISKHPKREKFYKTKHLLETKIDSFI